MIGRRGFLRGAGAVAAAPAVTMLDAKTESGGLYGGLGPPTSNWPDVPQTHATIFDRAAMDAAQKALRKFRLHRDYTESMRGAEIASMGSWSPVYREYIKTEVHKSLRRQDNLLERAISKIANGNWITREEVWDDDE